MRARWDFWRVVMLVVGVGLLALPAAAQFGRDDSDDLFRAEFSRRDLAIMTDMLQLDGLQRDLVGSMLDDYTDRYRSESERIQKKMTELRATIEESGDRRDWRSIMRPLTEARDEMRRVREDLARQFVSDVQAILSIDQVDRWPRYQQHTRRQRLLPRAMISGEAVDLFQVVAETLDEAERLTVEPILDDYAIRLDEALQRREDDLARSEERTRELMRSLDLDAALELVERQRRLRESIRDLHERTAKQISLVIPDTTALMEEFRRRAYPRVWEPTQTERRLAAALELEGIDAGVYGALESLVERYSLRIRTINEGLERTVREHESQSLERRIQMIQASARGDNVNWTDDPVQKAFLERSEYEETVNRELQGLLSDEQLALLPRLIERPGREGNGRQGPRGGRIGGGAGFQGFIRDGGGGDRNRDRDREDSGDGDGQGERPVDGRGFPQGLGDR